MSQPGRTQSNPNLTEKDSSEMDFAALIAQHERALAGHTNQRAAAHTEQRTMATGLAEGASLSDAQQARFSELATNKTNLDAKIAEEERKLVELRAAQADEERSAADALHTRSTDAKPQPLQTINREERTYSPDNAKREGRSFISDLYRAQFRSDYSAAARLEAHANEVRVEGEAGGEQRAVGTGAFAGLIPPVYLTEEAALMARAGRVFANIVRHLDLPAEGQSIIIPRGTTSSLTAVQTAENTNVASQDVAFTNLTVPVVTIAGQQDVSRQSLERGGADVDKLIYADLAADYAVRLDQQCLVGTGASGQMLGLFNTGGIPTVSAFTAAAAADTFYRKVAGAIVTVLTNRYLAPSGIVMHPRRWGWLTSLVDASNRPLVVPNPNGPSNAQGHFTEPLDTNSSAPVGWMQGVPIYTDANLPTAVGTGPEDQVVVTRLEDLLLWEDGDGSPKQLNFEQTLGNQLTVKLVAYGYAAFTAGRYPGASAFIGGNAASGFGLVAPTF